MQMEDLWLSLYYYIIKYYYYWKNQMLFVEIRCNAIDID